MTQPSASRPASPSASAAPLGVATLTVGSFIVFLNLRAPVLLAAGLLLIAAGPLLVLRPPKSRRRALVALLFAVALAQAVDLAAGFLGDLRATEFLLDGVALDRAPLGPIDHARTIVRVGVVVLSALTLAVAGIASRAPKKKGPDFSEPSS